MNQLTMGRGNCQGVVVTLHTCAYLIVSALTAVLVVVSTAYIYSRWLVVLKKTLVEFYALVSCLRKSLDVSKYNIPMGIFH